MELTYTKLRELMLKDMPKDSITTRSIEGIIDCSEKMGDTADKAFSRIVAAIDGNGTPKTKAKRPMIITEAYVDLGRVEDIELD